MTREEKRERFGVGEDTGRTDERRWMVVDFEVPGTTEDNLTESLADALCEAMNRTTVIPAIWDSQQNRYVVDPSHADCDVSGTSGTDGWWSEDGDNWLDFGGGNVAGDFDAVTIRLINGPRHGHVVG